MKSVDRNYVAKIAILAILRYVELRKSDFEINKFLQELGEEALDGYELFDKYCIKDVDRFIAALATQDIEDKAFFINLGLHGIASKIGSYSFFLQNSPNFKELLNKASQYSYVITDIVSSINVENAGPHIKVSYIFSRDALKFNEVSKSNIIDISFGALAVLYNEMAFSHDQTIEFHSEYAHQLSDEEVSNILGHKYISRSEGSYVLFPQAIVDIKNPKYEDNLPATISIGLSKHLEARNTGSLISIISNLLESKPSSSLDDISEQLHISKRTLQRRLKEQNINFTKLKRETLNEQSLELLLGKEHNIEEISKLMGYSSTAAFIHAFTNWHGVSPTTYLRNKEK